MKNELPDKIQTMLIGPNEADKDTFINAYDLTEDGKINLRNLNKEKYLLQ